MENHVEKLSEFHGDCQRLSLGLSQEVQLPSTLPIYERDVPG